MHNWKYVPSDGVIEPGIPFHFSTVVNRFYDFGGWPFYLVADTTLNKGSFAYDVRPAVEFENKSDLLFRHHPSVAPVILERTDYCVEAQIPYSIPGHTDCESITRWIHTDQQWSVQILVGVVGVLGGIVYAAQRANQKKGKRRPRRR